MNPAILFFDTETNGLPLSYHSPASDFENWPQVLQLAWSLEQEDADYSLIRRLDVGNDLILPGEDFVLDLGAAATHGLTAERLMNGRPIATVLKEFDEALSRADLLVAHNMAFDLPIVGAEMLRAGLDEAFARLQQIPKVCTMKGAADFCKLPGGRHGQRFKSPRLAELHQILFNEGFDGAHDAMKDVEALARCFWELVDLGVVAPLAVGAC